MVDQEDFREMMNFLDIESRGLKIMSRRTLGKHIDAYYEDVSRQLRKTLQLPTWVATTADVWSITYRRFLGMTVHWIDANFRRQSAALACRRFCGAHTFDQVAKLIKKVHESFNLSCDKICAAVTDNGSNFVKAFAVFGVDPENIIFEDADDATVEDEEIGDEGDEEVDQNQEDRVDINSTEISR